MSRVQLGKNKLPRFNANDLQDMMARWILQNPS